MRKYEMVVKVMNALIKQAKKSVYKCDMLLAMWDGYKMLDTLFDNGIINFRIYIYYCDKFTNIMETEFYRI